ncbi:hypothetical protein WJX84_005804 [Apatococcus fuscideae]|uniref:Uncharacterized protein n=1 Tax=Apatococcus fuscideae TaxID=2026836 RepID=A0AAW1T6K0_9CHLO
MMRGIFDNVGGIDMANYPHSEFLESTPEGATPSYTSYMHMLCFLYALGSRRLFGLLPVNTEDAVPKRDAHCKNVKCECGTSAQQHAAKHTVGDLVMRDHRFLLDGGFELYDLALPKNTNMKRWQF